MGRWCQCCRFPMNGDSSVFSPRRLGGQDATHLTICILARVPRATAERGSGYPPSIASFDRSLVQGGAGTASLVPFTKPACLLTTCRSPRMSLCCHFSLESVTAVLGTKYSTARSIRATFPKHVPHIREETWLPALEDAPLSSMVLLKDSMAPGSLRFLKARSLSQ